MQRKQIVPKKADALLSKLNELSVWNGTGVEYALEETGAATVVLIISDGEKSHAITGKIQKAQIYNFLLYFLRLAIAEGVLQNVSNNTKVN